MLKRIATTLAFFLTFGLGHITVSACMCPGFNPDIYPPDMQEVRRFYQREFRGAAFTGKVVSITDIPGEVTKYGDKVLEIEVEVDRAWTGVTQSRMKIYTSTNPCGLRFRLDGSYFFIPNIEDGRLFIGTCTYASYSSKVDGNFVDLMVAVFGSGRIFLDK